MGAGEEQNETHEGHEIEYDQNTRPGMIPGNELYPTRRVIPSLLGLDGGAVARPHLLGAEPPAEGPGLGCEIAFAVRAVIEFGSVQLVRIEITEISSHKETPPYLKSIFSG
jgi:hypothetical protein